MSAQVTAREQAAHIPRWVHARLQSRSPSVDGMTESHTAAVLMIDIAGFTAKTDRAAGDGAESLTYFINDCFAVLVEVIEAQGGDIVAFAGDAILAVWSDVDAAAATEQAARCGIALRQAMTDRHGGDRISARIAIETGEVFFCKLGGWQDKWHYVAVGDPFYRIGEAYQKAEIGDIALCANAARLLSNGCEIEPTSYGVRLLQINPLNAAGKPVEDSQPIEYRAPRDSNSASDWVGEFRTLTIARIALPDFQFNEGFLTKLQTFVRDVQQISERLEGTVHQVLMDDKGLTLTLVFGLAPFAHEDDSFRAVEACLRLRRQLEADSISISIGISTGRLFCSNYGGLRQQTFGIFGQAINIAAHFAEAAQGEIVCDATTAQAVGRRVAFTLLPHLHLKGASASILAFNPTAVTEDLHAPKRRTIIDRTSETALLVGSLDDLGTGAGKLIQILGEAGIGKSRLLQEFVGLAEAAGHAVLFASGTAIEKSTPYFVWRTVLRQIFLFESPADAIRVRRDLAETVQGNESLSNWLPLIEEVIPLGFSQSVFTEQIVGSARASAIEEIVIFLLRRSQFRTLVMEDVHWFDGPSIELLSAAVRRLSEFLIVVTQRTESTTAPRDLPAIELTPSLQIRLEGLPRDHVRLLIERRLRSAELPSELVQYVYGHAGGNPFFSEELALALRDTGKIQVSRGVCSINERNFADSSISLSTSVERAIVSRIDLLSPDDQLVLKAASVVGDAFSSDLLDWIVPELSADTKAECVRRLMNHDFLQLDRDTPPLFFVFRHSITMEVAYNLLSFAQRRTLHRRIADFIESHHSNELQPNYARLARHLEFGGEPLRAIAYLELAAQQSRNNFANREAIRYAQRMFDLNQAGALQIHQSRTAGWEVILGDAYHELSDYANSSEHYGRALQLLGHHVPESKLAKVAALIRNATTQLQLRLFPRRRAYRSEQERIDAERAAHIYEHLSEQYFFQNDSVAVLNGTLASLNLAEQCGAARETARGYSALALGMGMSGLVSIARAYGSRATQLAGEHGALSEIARVHLVLGVLDYGLGKWASAEKNAEQARQLYARLGDRKRAHNSETMAIFIAFLRGQISHADSRLKKLLTEVSEDSPPQVQAWSLSAAVLIDHCLGRCDAARLLELRALISNNLIRTDQLLCAGSCALGYSQLADDRALEFAERGLRILRECGVVWGGYVYGAAGIADVFLNYCLSNPGAVPASVQDETEQACRQLSRLARSSPLCRPYNFLMKGRLLLVNGQRAKAVDCWKRAATAAELMQMPRERARALYEIGKASEENAADPTSHLAQAAAIFERLGAVRELTELREVQGRLLSQSARSVV
jgi:class 3 adenylate cyclase/tetratricopeptide (TPR) repeat protein